MKYYVFLYATCVGNRQESFGLESSTPEGISFIQNWMNNFQTIINDNVNTSESILYHQINNYWKNNVVGFLSPHNSDNQIKKVISFIKKLNEGEYVAIIFNSKPDDSIIKEIERVLEEKMTGLPVGIDKEVDFLNIYHTFARNEYKRIWIGQESGIRKCRFCGKSTPEVSFSNKSHTISHGLGNNNIFTYDECNLCNHKYGTTIEQEFIDYVSFYKTISVYDEHLNNHTTNNSYITLSANRNLNHLELTIKGDSIIKNNGSKNEIVCAIADVNYKNIYRALVKYVIGYLPDNELAYFNEAVKWLNNPSKCLQLSDVKYLVCNDSVTQPYLWLYIRKSAESHYPYMLAEFRCFCIKFFFVVPGCSKDSATYKRNIVDDILTLKQDDGYWKTIDMQKEGIQKHEIRIPI